jgi:hypothetical protein
LRKESQALTPGTPKGVPGVLLDKVRPCAADLLPIVKASHRPLSLANGDMFMAILLTPETERLIEARMKETGASSPDELVRLAVQTFGEIQGIAFEDLDPETQAAINEGEAQYERGEGTSLDQAFEQFRRNATA